MQSLPVCFLAYSVKSKVRIRYVFKIMIKEIFQDQQLTLQETFRLVGTLQLVGSN